MLPSEHSNETARLFALTVLWGGSFLVLSRFGADLMPRALLGLLSLESYLALVQIATLAVGLSLSLALLGAPAHTLGVARPTPLALATTLGLAPAVFSLATTTAFLVARPTLLAELAEGGRALAQRNSGEFGRELVRAPALLTVFWGAVVSPISEELFFRGALWSLVRRWSTMGEAARADELSGGEGGLAEFVEVGLSEHAFHGVATFLRDGGFSTLLVAVVFGILHKDMPGGLGIVRFVAALGLGFACGVARQLSGTVVAACVLHLVFNALSIATVRRWVVTSALPMKWGAPTAISAVAVVGVALVATLLRVRHARRA